MLPERPKFPGIKCMMSNPLLTRPGRLRSNWGRLLKTLLI